MSLKLSYLAACPDAYQDNQLVQSLKSGARTANFDSLN
jgi:hypothetical protein